ncbi:hypothetical protein ACHAWF_001026, partial [Thalassiosira exigua]
RQSRRNNNKHKTLSRSQSPKADPGLRGPSTRRGGKAFVGLAVVLGLCPGNAVKMASISPRGSSPPPPATMEELDHRTVPAWFLSFSAAMVPFCAFCYGHSRGLTTRVVERVVKSPVGVYGLFALPFLTLGMEKSVYDTVQAWQGIDPNVRPADRGGFPSGGAELPSFSLIPVRKVARKLTQMSQLTESSDES